jgi:uncharacterized RDD family membrane protein YckC
MILVYDGLLFCALSMVALAIFVIVTMLVNPDVQQSNPDFLKNNPAVVLLLIATTFIYYGYSLVRMGQTLGMLAWQVKIVDETGQEKITWSQAAARYGASVVGLANLVMFFNPQRRGLQDIASQTIQILVKPEKKEKAK